MTLPPEQYRQMERHVPELEAVEPPRIKPRSLLLWIAAGFVSWLVLLALGWGFVHALAALQDATSRSAQEPFPYIGVGGSPALTGVPRIQRELALSGTPQAPRTISGTATWYCLSGSSACTRGYGQSDLVAAIDTDLGFRKGDHVTVTYRGRSVTVRIVDTCACPGDRLIDLTSGAFRRLADLHLGVIPVSLRLAGPAVTLPPTDSEGGNP